jgi:hypothetical protein
LINGYGGRKASTVIGKRHFVGIVNEEIMAEVETSGLV